MNKLIGYVIYPEEQPQQLSAFYQQVDNLSFQPVKAEINAFHQLSANQFFNTEKFKQQYNRLPFADEIGQTLAHLQCWRNIAENENLTDNDYAIIAESAVRFTPNYVELINIYIEKYPYDIIKLQRHIRSEITEELKLSSGDVTNIGAVIYSNPEQLDGNGASLYLIRKNIAKQIVEQYEEKKPFWRSDDFSLFYNHEKIIEVNNYLGYIPQPIKRKKAKPFFSVIIPVYNVDRYLAQCLDSVLAQDFEDYEMLLINDGATDYSAEICFDYAKRYPQISLIHKPNEGLSAARNCGIKLAKGEYIIFLDSDDYWTGTTILTEINRLINDNEYPDVIINSYATQSLKDRNQIIEISNLNQAEKLNLTGHYRLDYLKLVKEDIYLGFAWAKIIKRNLIIDNQIFFPEGKNYEDVKWSFELSFYIQSYCLYPVHFYIYRIGRSGSITEYVRKENILDLFYVLNDDLALIAANKSTHPEMYSGWVIVINRSYEYAQRCYGMLSIEDQKAIEADFIHFKTLALETLGEDLKIS